MTPLGTSEADTVIVTSTSTLPPAGTVISSWPKEMVAFLDFSAGCEPAVNCAAPVPLLTRVTLRVASKVVDDSAYPKLSPASRTAAPFTSVESP